MVPWRRLGSSGVAGRVNGQRLTRQKRLEVRGRVAAGESFDDAADAVRCTTKTVQRQLNSVGGVHRARKMRWNPAGDWVWSERQTHPRDHPARHLRDGPGHLRGRAAFRSPQETRTAPRCRGWTAARCVAAKCKGHGTTTTPTTAASSQPSTRSPRNSTPRRSTSGNRRSCRASTPWIGSLFTDEHLDATCEALAAVSDHGAEATSMAKLLEAPYP
jgi:hypothetical protein